MMSIDLRMYEIRSNTDQHPIRKKQNAMNPMNLRVNDKEIQKQDCRKQADNLKPVERKRHVRYPQTPRQQHDGWLDQQRGLDGATDGILHGLLELVVDGERDGREVAVGDGQQDEPHEGVGQRGLLRQGGYAVHRRVDAEVEQHYRGGEEGRRNGKV